MKAGAALIVVILISIALPGNSLAGGADSPARSAPAPEALQLPDSASPIGWLIGHVVDPAYVDSASTSGFQVGSVFHNTWYAAAGMVTGYYQAGVLKTPAGYTEEDFWLASIYGTDAQAEARVEDAKSSMRSKVKPVVEVSPCPEVSPQNCSFFSGVGSTTTGSDAQVLYTVWSQGSVVAELVLAASPASAVAGSLKDFAGQYTSLLKAAAATMDAAVPAPTATPTLTPTSPPTVTPSPVPTATSTTTPTATATAAPTATSVVLRLKLVVRSSLRAGHSGSIRVSVTQGSAADHSGQAAVEGRGVPGASVAVDGRSVGIKQVLHAMTNGSGTAIFAHIRPLKVGAIAVHVAKSGFVGATMTVRVRP